MSQEPVLESEASTSPESAEGETASASGGVIALAAPERNEPVEPGARPAETPSCPPGEQAQEGNPVDLAAGPRSPGEADEEAEAGARDAGPAAPGTVEPAVTESAVVRDEERRADEAAREDEETAPEAPAESDGEGATDRRDGVVGEANGSTGSVESPAKPEVPPAPTFASELPKRSQRPGALALLKLEKVEEDATFRLRPEGEIDSLATSIARLGQLVPVDLRLRPPDRFQIVCGFRRVAALRLLKRERILARVHTDLNDEDALQISLADLLETRGADREDLVGLRERLREQGRLSIGVADTLERAISPPDEELAPEMVDGPDEEVDLDELAQDLTGRLAAVNQDLALVVELWSALEPQLRETLLEQLSYPEQLAAYLRGLR